MEVHRECPGKWIYFLLFLMVSHKRWCCVVSNTTVPLGWAEGPYSKCWCKATVTTLWGKRGAQSFVVASTFLATLLARSLENPWILFCV